MLWAGLVLSLSQSSFAALLGGLAVLAALRWRARWMLAASVAAAAASAAVLLLAPGAIEVDTRTEASLDRATSGRFDLVSGALDMARDRPVWGFGTGSFAERYRAREGVSSERVAAISHTIPLTVAAEQGIVGLLAYLALMVAALLLVFPRGLRARLRARPTRRGGRRARGRGGGFLRARAAHPRVRRLPGGPAGLDAARHRGRAGGAPGGPRGARRGAVRGRSGPRGRALTAGRPPTLHWC